MQLFTVVNILETRTKTVDSALKGLLPKGSLCFEVYACWPEISLSCFFSRGESLNALTVDAEAVLGERDRLPFEL